jgi:hypothetical protein
VDALPVAPEVVLMRAGAQEPAAIGEWDRVREVAGGLMEETTHEPPKPRPPWWRPPMLWPPPCAKAGETEASRSTAADAAPSRRVSPGRLSPRKPLRAGAARDQTEH